MGKDKLLRLAISGVVIAAVLALAWGPLRNAYLERTFSFRGQEYQPPRPAADFVLQDQHGRRFHFAESPAEATVLFFGYTFCPDVCPGTLAEMRQVKEMLKEQADRVQFLFVTVDPERDTPERLKEYLSRFDEEFVGLTGSEAEVAEVIEAYRIVAKKEPMPDSRAGYLVSHTATTFIIDRDRNLRLRMAYGLGPEAMAHDLRGLLNGWDG